MTWSFWLPHANEPIRLVRHDSLIDYRLEVLASAFAFCPVSESSSGPLPAIVPLFHQPTPSSIRYPILTQETGNALVIPIGINFFIAITNNVDNIERLL
ncbi:hypothetical protein EVAR_103286_1 [Eumeta japonica]|uniref:Uncharacterized protein n=1 Tax=Eumeta variegata TaxID=151549 RepID=A0A4C1XS82_EUMVA|nr:hypothetical protein EVAR_103286_1 [Eumeta japonica]